MKPNSTLVLLVSLCSIFSFPQLSLSQFSPGFPARFGIDGDALSGQALNISGSSSQGSFDWFKKTGSGINVGIGVIDTSNTATYKEQIASGQNVTFSRGMAFPRYSDQGGFLLLDARYSRDNFGLSMSGSQSDLTTYTSGSKNGDNPTTWVTTPGGGMVADKADIIDTYIHMRRNGTVINNTNPSSLILAMGVNTIGNTGNRYVDFELFRTRIAYNSSTGLFSNSGPSSTGGHSAWEFNTNNTVKEIGDMAVSFTYSTAGVEEIAIYIWVSQINYNNVTPSKFSFVPNEFYGSGFGYAKITSLTPSGFNAWGTASTGTTKSAPWGSNSKTSGSSTNNYYAKDYAAYDFGEVAIDLTSLGIDPALSVGMNPCTPPFTRVMAKTRSSSTFTSALQDFTGPYEFLDAPQAPAQIAAPANLKCNVPTVTLSPAVPVSGAVYQWTTTTGNITSNPNAATITVDKAGKYFLTAAIVAGCPTNSDSTIVKSDNYKPVASAYTIGQLDPGVPGSFVNIQGGDVAASNYNTPYGGSAGLDWKWTGPNGFTANTRNTYATQIGTYTLVLTEQRNGCKDTAITPVLNMVILPVTYLSFDAAVLNKMVMLKWKTADEINNSHFEVERSFDINNFISIGIVSNAVTVAGNDRSYQFEDNSKELQTKTMVYYRLKQTDLNGKISYSKVIAVRLQAINAVVMQVSPNPFVENLNVRYNSSEKNIAEIRLINAMGQAIIIKQIIMSKGYNNVQVEGLSKLNSGLYIAQLVINGLVIDNQKIIKN
jgi:hypothetical protein